MITSVTIFGEVEKTLLQHTFRLHPKEACALLFGVCNADSCAIPRAIPARNAKRSNDFFAIRRRDYDRITALSSLPCIGVYHTHRTTTQPSPYDCHQIHQGSIWLIGMLADNSAQPFLELAAYTRRAFDIFELRLRRNNNDDRISNELRTPLGT